MKVKRKRVFSLAVAFAVLFSTVGKASATELVESDTQPAVRADAELNPIFDKTEETKKEIKENTEEETEEVKEREENTEEENEEGTKEREENIEEINEETKEDEENTEENTEEETEEAKENVEEETEEEIKETEENTEKETEEAKGNAEEETEEAKENTEEETEEAGENTEEQTEETEKNAEEETEEAGENTEKVDLSVNLNGESLMVSENSDLKPSAERISGIHEHNWSVDWNYDGSCHWHECSEKDCPATDNSEKDGFEEHSYNDDGICTECGYDAMDGIAAAAEGDVPTYREAYEIMTALKEEYPEGMTWTNFEPYGSKGALGSAYTWKGGAVYGARSAVGCMAFAFILSDAVFDRLPARAIERGNFTFEDVKVGDILRVEGNSHSVIILQKSAGGVTVAEANFKKTVHWGRSMSAADVEKADFMITRYPAGYVPADDPGADEVAHEGTEGKLHWSLTNAGVLTISGDGAIPNYSSNNAPWSSYHVQTIIIEEGVTKIGDYAFCQSEALSVYIPDSVTAIGKNAFSQSALVAVTIPGSVKTIGANAFYKCVNLTSATVSEGVEIIENDAFRGCTALAYIDFPTSITSVGAGAFMSCEKMQRVRFMPGSGTVTMGDNLFSQCQYLTSVTLPQTADRISAGMFASCTVLPELYIPASVTEIGNDPTSESPFNACNNLRLIYFGGSEAKWESMLNPYLRPTLRNTTVIFNAEFKDPFAADPDDPGDFQPGEDAPCTNHVDADKDGKCDNCGKTMSTDNPGTGDSEGGDKNNPDDSGKDPADPGDGNPPSSTGGSGNSGSSGNSSGSGNSGSSGNSSGSGSSGNSSGSGSSGNSSGSGSSGNSGGSDNSGNSGGLGGSWNLEVFSTTINRKSDGSSTVTKILNDGTVITTRNPLITDKAEMEVKLSALAVRAAEQYGAAVALPVLAVEAAKDIAAASAITVYTGKDELVNVAIPAVSPTAGTVAVMVNADGSAEVIRNSVPTRDSVIALLPDGATVKIVDNSRNFLDVPAGAWFEDAAAFVSARELFYGTTETAFAPDEPMTCALLMTALARFDGTETDGGMTWYERSMEWAAVHGLGAGAAPESYLTGEQWITALWKYCGSPASAGTLSVGTSGGQRSDTLEAVGWAMEKGIVREFEYGALNLQGQINRAQAAQIMMNFAQKISLSAPGK